MVDSTCVGWSPSTPLNSCLTWDIYEIPCTSFSCTVKGWWKHQQVVVELWWDHACEALRPPLLLAPLPSPSQLRILRFRDSRQLPWVEWDGFKRGKAGIFTDTHPEAAFWIQVVLYNFQGSAWHDFVLLLLLFHWFLIFILYLLPLPFTLTLPEDFCLPSCSSH